MPITINTNQVSFKDGGSNTYITLDGIADKTTEDRVVEIEEAGSSQIAAIQAAGVETRASIPADYTELSDEVDDLKSQNKLGAYYLDGLQDLEEDLYRVIDVTWEQGGFRSSGDYDDTVWIRTGLLLGGFMYHNNGGTNRITVARYIDSTGQ